MVTQPRMSAFAALFLSVAFVVMTGIVAGTVVTIYGMHVVDDKASGILALAQDAVTGLPEFIDKLPPAISDALHDRRAPEYQRYIETSVTFAEDAQSGFLVPAVQINNAGSEVVSLLGVRVTVVNKAGRPICSWSEVAATPTAIDDWTGPLLPGNKRFIVLPSRRILTNDLREAVSASVEVSEIRVWLPQSQTALASAP